MIIAKLLVTKYPTVNWTWIFNLIAPLGDISSFNFWGKCDSVPLNLPWKDYVILNEIYLITSHYIILGVPLDILIKSAKLKWRAGHVIRMHPDKWTKAVMQWIRVDWSRHWARPKKRNGLDEFTYESIRHPSESVTDHGGNLCLAMARERLKH